jgi:hypothetical protein
VDHSLEDPTATQNLETTWTLLSKGKISQLLGGEIAAFFLKKKRKAAFYKKRNQAAYSDQLPLF